VTKPSSPPSKLIDSSHMISLESICPKHGKKFEGKGTSKKAFCEEDKQLICVSCILEGYKSKKILSIEEVATLSKLGHKEGQGENETGF
jgi:hypothetical protein